MEALKIDIFIIVGLSKTRFRPNKSIIRSYLKPGEINGKTAWPIRNYILN